MMKKKAQWVGSVNSSEHEQYRCLVCEKDYERQDVEGTWKCPECADEYVYIYAKNMGTGAKIALTRKAACEVQIGEWVHFPLMWSECYEVLAINKRRDRLGLALAKHGEVTMHPFKPVNVREGSW